LKTGIAKPNKRAPFLFASALEIQPRKPYFVFHIGKALKISPKKTNNKHTPDIIPKARVRIN